MAISHVNTQTGTQASATSVSANRPVGSTTGDLFIATFAANSQDVTAPSGWVGIADETTEVFRCQMFRKVAGGSEPASYSFSVASAAPLVLSISAFRGIDPATPIGIDPVTATALTSSEPRTTPSVTGGNSGRLLYLRAVRFSGSTPTTFTASSVTELADVGVFSGGSVCYSLGLYMANSDYAGSGSKSGLAITASSAESHNITATLGINATSIPGTMDIDLPSIPSATMAGSVSVPGTLDATLPLPEVGIDVFHGDPAGLLDTLLPQLGVDVAATINPAGALGVTVLPTLDFGGETRYFSDNVITIHGEERWLIITQDGYRDGDRRGTRDLRFIIELPPLGVSFSVNVSPLGHTVPVDVETFDAAITASTLTEEALGVSATAEDATVLFGDLGEAGEEITATAEAYDSTVTIGALAELVSVELEALQSSGYEAPAEPASDITVDTYGAAVRQGVRVFAEHVSVTCHN